MPRTPSVPADARAEARCWRRHWPKRVALGVAATVVLLNALAFWHARGFMHFAPGGRRVRNAATLSWTHKLRYLFTGVRLPRPVNRKTPGDAGLAYETVTFSGHAGARIEAWRIPHGAARGQVLLFHGYGDSKSSLLPAARAFHDLGYATVLVDFYGSGGSSGDTTSVGYFEAEDVAATRRAMPPERGSGPTVLFGESMGAAAVLRAAGELGVSADVLVLEAPFDRLVTTVEHRFEAMHAPSFPAARLLLFWGGVQQGFAPNAFAPAEYARNVPIPTLLMVGDRDRYVSVGEARHILNALAGPKRLEVFAGARHQNLVRADRIRWLRVTSQFLGAFAKPPRREPGAPQATLGVGQRRSARSGGSRE